jgi:hypothetical protein
MLRLLASAVLVVGVASSALAAPREDVEKAADSRDKVICKRYTETGSLAKITKTCKTKRDWDADRDAARASLSPGSCASNNNGGACN